MLNRLSYGIKLLIACLLLVGISVSVMGVMIHVQVSRELTSLGESMITSSVRQLVGTLKLENDLLQQKVDSDLAILVTNLSRLGTLALDDARPVSMRIVNQANQQAEEATFPLLTAGGSPLTKDYGVVDDIQKNFGGTATIFQVLPGKLLRVSTNVRKLDGERAVGTYIPSDSAVYKTVMAGETYHGRAFVVNDWYVTAYKPLRDASGNIVAVVYVGRRILTPEMRTLLQNITIADRGYAFVANSAGDLLVHPDKELENRKKLGEFDFGQKLLDARDTLVRYAFNGPRVAYMTYFEPWDWHVGIGLTEKDMLHGVDDEVLHSILVSTGGAGLLAVLAALAMSAVLVRPLKRMTAVARRMGEGDMAARMDVTTSDEVGSLARAFNHAMDKVDASMRESQIYINMLNAVGDPIFAVDDTHRFIAANTATLDIAGMTKEQIRGVTCASVFNTSVCNSPDCPINQSMGSRLSVVAEVVEIKLKGESRFVKPTAAPLEDIDGRHAGYVEVAKDVTDLVRKEQELAANFERIRQVNGEINTAGHGIAANAESVAAQLEQVRRGAEQQSERAGETATAMEEMNATVMEVARNAADAAANADNASQKAREGVDVVGKAVASIQDVREQVMRLKDRMGTLGGQADSIGQIIGVINDIADQTNLLALNAAIEAARAGDAGRGFAVVADEVRKLAEKTMSATRQVAEAISSIQGGTREAISATDNAARNIVESTELASRSGERLNEILTLVESTSSKVQSIATAAEEQSAASEEIVRAVGDISRISAETSQGMNAAGEAVEELGSLAVRLRDLSRGE